MRVTLLGTGSPVPTLERAGTSIAVETPDEKVMIDCGPKAVHRLIENEIQYGEVEDLFITHHHLDHNASFFEFVFTSWAQGGRESLTVYGPDGTETLLESMYEIYEDDLEYRKQIYPTDGITDIETETLYDGFSTTVGRLEISTIPVNHSIETHALKVKDTDNGTSFVFSSDTSKIPELEAFAKGTDVLVQDACIAPFDEDEVPENGLVWDQYRTDDTYSGDAVHKNHCTTADADEIAREADVDTLVLTHLLPYRDTEAMQRQADEAFDGNVIVAEDGLTLDL